MGIDRQTDTLLRALAILRALEETLASAGPAVPRTLARQYNEALDLLSMTGEDVDGFRIPAPTHAGSGDATVVVLTRVRSVLGYFDLRGAVVERAQELHEEPARLIGFSTRRDGDAG